MDKIKHLYDSLYEEFYYEEFYYDKEKVDTLVYMVNKIREFIKDYLSSFNISINYVKKPIVNYNKYTGNYNSDYFSTIYGPSNTYISLYNKDNISDVRDYVGMDYNDMTGDLHISLSVMLKNIDTFYYELVDALKYNEELPPLEIFIEMTDFFTDNMKDIDYFIIPQTYLENNSNSIEDFETNIKFLIEYLEIDTLPEKRIQERRKGYMTIDNKDIIEGLRILLRGRKRRGDFDSLVEYDEGWDIKKGLWTGNNHPYLKRRKRSGERLHSNCEPCYSSDKQLSKLSTSSCIESLIRRFKYTGKNKQIIDIEPNYRFTFSYSDENYKNHIIKGINHTVSIIRQCIQLK
jgi:hypothetical protein